jgi:hypothetical protein
VGAHPLLRQVPRCGVGQRRPDGPRPPEGPRPGGARDARSLGDALRRFWADGELPDQTGAAVKLWKTEKLEVRLDDDGDEALVEASSGSKLLVGDDVVSESGGAKHSVGDSGVVDEAGSTKLEVTTSSFRVNGGALEVS